MGEAKRRKQLDPTWGTKKEKDLSGVWVFFDLEDQGGKAGSFHSYITPEGLTEEEAMADYKKECSSVNMKLLGYKYFKSKEKAIKESNRIMKETIQALNGFSF